MNIEESEFQKQRSVLYSVQHRLRNKHAELESLAYKLKILQTEFNLKSQEYDVLTRQLNSEFDEISKTVNVRIYTDMGWNGKDSDTYISYGGLIIENDVLTTVTGLLNRVPNLTQGPTLYEGLSLITVTAWYLEQNPSTNLEIYTDNDEVIKIFEHHIRCRGARHKNITSEFLRKKIEKTLCTDRIFPRWITRESPEIRLCDALARRKLEKIPQRIIYLRMLDIAQGSVKSRWTPESQKLLHSYHRSTKLKWQLREDGFTHRPPL